MPVFEDAATMPAIFITKRISPTNDIEQDFLFTQIKTLKFASLESEVKEKAINLTDSAIKGDNWSLIGGKEAKIIDKIRSNALSIKEYINGDIKRGVLTGFNEAFIIDSRTRDRLVAEDSKSIEIIKPFIVGDDVRKYQIHFKGLYIIWTYIGVDIEKYPAIKKHLEQFKEKLEKRWDKGNYWYELRACDFYSDFEKEKIIYPTIGKEPRFTFDDKKYFTGDTTFIIPRRDFFLLSILNSKIIYRVFQNLCSTLGDVEKGGRIQLKPVYYIDFPLIRRISFTTSPDRCAALVEEAKMLYSEFLVASGTQKILDFVSQRLSAAPEESDVVHDLLAYLAERMIEMNKEKNAEIKGFLDFLKGEIGASIDDLSNKTAIQEYYEHEFQNLIDVLFKNKKKLKAGYDPKSPANYKHLLEWYNVSKYKLKPLIDRIEATDGLIDQIVYKLYGLTEEEIKIVEESISG